MKTFLNDNWLKLVAIVMLLGAIASYFGAWFTRPYAYYQMMNWVVVSAALMAVWQSYKMGKQFPVWLFALVAVVFNPITQIYLSAFTWQVANIVVIVLFLISFFAMRERGG
jgi:FtsH-binding integral membrane protein